MPALLAAALLGACSSPPPESGEFVPAQQIADDEPIPYPPDLFRQGIEGEVMLHLVIDSSGAVIRDSIRIETSSGHAEFDAAALTAAPSLRFQPARRGDTAVTAPLKVPIHFTVPDSNSADTP